jgi:hypothetical protein
MDDLSDITQVALDALESRLNAQPAPRSAFCADGLEEFRFHLHVHARSLIAEIRRHRTAVAASQERVREVVLRVADPVVRKLLGCGAGMDPDTSGARAVAAIAARVAEQLAGGEVQSLDKEFIRRVVRERVIHALPSDPLVALDIANDCAEQLAGAAVQLSDEDIRLVRNLSASVMRFGW